MTHRIVRLGLWSLLFLAGLAAILALAAWLLLRGSLAPLDGQLALPGLTAPVQVQRDRLGTVTIDAASEADAIRALGYVHAQERYFEMDLLRRTAAGELAALVGPAALDVDREHRVHRFRTRAQLQMDAIAGDRQPQLQAYVEGVNAGLGALSVRPWPYLLLRQRPQPWQAADTPLVGDAMYFDLQGGANARELALWRMRPHLPEPLYALLVRDGTRWDAPLLGEPRGDAELPGADEVDLRELPAPASPPTDRGGRAGGSADGQEPASAALAPAVPVRAMSLATALRGGGDGSPAAADLRPGSNNFAVSGALTADRRAILADDMHLGLRAPNLWFRVRLRYPDRAAPGGRVDVSGFSLPGLPMVVVGSNRHVAWGFTNSYGDYQDWKREVPCTGGRRDPDDCAPVQRARELIEVAGGAPVPFDVEQTEWGPVMHRLEDGSVLTLRWTAHLRDAINFGVGRFAAARSLEGALDIADETGIPTQNLLVADRNGRIAWRLLGPMARRLSGCDGSRLVEGAEAPPEAGATQGEDARADAPAPGAGCKPWDVNNAGRISLQSPTAQRLWTANNRTVDGDSLRRMGNGGFALGARAQQIRDRLRAADTFTERDLLAIQLDDRAVFLQPWWKLLVRQAAASRTPAMAALSTAAKDWDGHAGVDSTAYRVVRAWRLAVHERIAQGLTAPAQAAMGEAFEMPALPQFEGVVWPLVEQRPDHLLPRRFKSWDALFEDAAAEVRDTLSGQGPLAARTWGEHNTADICHPLARALPGVARRWLCMPADPLPGDGAMPRVQRPSFGASERMVVSPGREQDGIIQMPGGQSGHILSPYWGAGHDDWVHGRPSPFLPGTAEHTLRLVP